MACQYTGSKTLLSFWARMKKCDSHVTAGIHPQVLRKISSWLFMLRFDLGKAASTRHLHQPNMTKPFPDYMCLHCVFSLSNLLTLTQTSLFQHMFFKKMKRPFHALMLPWNLLSQSFQGIIQDVERGISTWRKIEKLDLKLVASMTAEDAASTAMIEANNQQLSDLAKSITVWRQRLSATSREWDLKNAGLAFENARLATEHRNLQATSQHRAKQQFIQLKQLLMQR